MKYFIYLRYFFFLAYNWNIRIAWHMIQHEIKGEKKYGIQSSGFNKLQQLEKRGIDTQHATLYMPVSYDVLETVLTQVPLPQCKHFIDIGCGMGRALCVAATMGARKLSGIDFSKEFCEAARKNLQSISRQTKGFEYHIFHNDAFYFEIPHDADILFLFNPFDEVIMSGVIENIETSLALHPRKLNIIYVNPLEKHLFLEAGFEQIYYTWKLQYLEAVILQKPA